MNKSKFNLFIFHRNIDIDLTCVKGGAAGIIVDLESRDKKNRQLNFDTQINNHSINNVNEIKQQSNIYVICRINPVSSDSVHEIEQVIDARADEILIPMINSENQLKEVLDTVNDRIKVGILIETVEAVAITKKLVKYPLQRVYVGLNDLRISRGSESIFEALADGTIESIHEKIKDISFGFAGLTLPDKGEPLASMHLINLMARLDCNFTFLRRSFFRDTLSKDVGFEIPRIHDALQRAKNRSVSAVNRDQMLLSKSLKNILSK